MSYIHKKNPCLHITFMGTGLFAAIILKKLIDNKNTSVNLIITKPDKKIGRQSKNNRNIAFNPIKSIAQKNKITLIQPSKLDTTVAQYISLKKSNAIIVASYGKILPKQILTQTQYGAFNVHASLLPRFRGSSPIQHSLLYGDTKTGATIIKMDEGLDTGNIIAQKHHEIKPEDTYETILETIGTLGAQLLCDTIPFILSESITQKVQNDKEATFCQLLSSKNGHINWNNSTQQIYNQYRALHKWPGIFSYFYSQDNTVTKKIKLHTIKKISTKLSMDEKSFSPGTIFKKNKQMHIKTNDSAIIALTVQPESKKQMSGIDFLNGSAYLKNKKLF